MENINIDILKNSNPIVCENEDCGNETFSEVVYLRKVSKILTGSPKDSYVPIPTFQCSKCGHINNQFKGKFE
jgi:hypothetical protein